MLGVIADSPSYACGALGDVQTSRAAATLMNPLNALTSPLSGTVCTKHQEGLKRDFMGQMIDNIKENPDETPEMDIGGKDKRPCDLIERFDPKMDQDVNLFTGTGDYMITIV